MDFEKRKRATLAAINIPEEEYTDKSPKGTIDFPIIPLLNSLNSHPSFFTTSSCSGGISILSQPAAAAGSATKKKARGGTWVFISHDPVHPDSVLNLLFSPLESTQHSPDPPQDLVFRFEPLIIAVECKDISSAQSLVSIAISCGFRESGIISVSKRVIVAIRCSIRLEVPLRDTHKLMVSPEYVKYLVGIANEKMEANGRRTDHFHTALLSNGFQAPETNALLSNGFQAPETNVGRGNSVDSECVETIKSESCLDYPQEDVILRRDDDYDSNCGYAEIPVFILSTIQMVIVGEPIERLYLWGHSACAFDKATHKKVLIFGGFGGMGSHARRNDYFLLDSLCGKLEEVDIQGRPSPRLGHTSSLVGDLTHQHTAAIIGPKLYVFGGILDDLIYPALHVLDGMRYVSKGNGHAHVIPTLW